MRLIPPTFTQASLVFLVLPNVALARWTHLAIFLLTFALLLLTFVSCFGLIFPSLRSAHVSLTCFLTPVSSLVLSSQVITGPIVAPARYKDPEEFTVEVTRRTDGLQGIMQPFVGGPLLCSIMSVHKLHLRSTSVTPHCTSNPPSAVLVAVLNRLRCLQSKTDRYCPSVASSDRRREFFARKQ